MINLASLLFAATPFIGAIGGSYILDKRVQKGKELLAKKGIFVKSKSWGQVREQLKKQERRFKHKI